MRKLILAEPQLKDRNCLPGEKRTESSFRQLQTQKNHYTEEGRAAALGWAMPRPPLAENVIGEFR